MTPLQNLVGFTKVQLSAGASSRVSVPLDPRQCEDWGALREMKLPSRRHVVCGLRGMAAVDVNTLTVGVVISLVDSSVRRRPWYIHGSAEHGAVKQNPRKGRNHQHELARFRRLHA